MGGFQSRHLAPYFRFSQVTRKEGDNVQSSPFKFLEILFYILPGLLIYCLKRWGRPYFQILKGLPLTFEMCLIPSWFVLIYSFGWLIFGFNYLPITLLLTSFTLGLQFYGYLQTIEEFTFKKYLPLAFKLLFVLLSFNLVGVILLRLWQIIF